FNLFPTSGKRLQIYRSIIHEYSLTSLANLYPYEKHLKRLHFFTNELINLIKVYHLALKKTMLPKKYFLEF
ncbi:hypothetical protein, partial [Enterococcus faecalis]|uniref:hypothetical protein n=1 Tax=Enterococcus faecalis TaxID=1351 RepID=UPI00325A9550